MSESNQEFSHVQAMDAQAQALLNQAGVASAVKPHEANQDPVSPVAPSVDYSSSVASVGYPAAQGPIVIPITNEPVMAMPEPYAPAPLHVMNAEETLHPIHAENTTAQNSTSDLHVKEGDVKQVDATVVEPVEAPQKGSMIMNIKAGLRVVLMVFSFAALVSASVLGRSQYFFSSINFLIFNAVITLLACLFLVLEYFVTPLHNLTHSMIPTNNIRNGVTLIFDAGATLFWFSGFVSIAVFATSLHANKWCERVEEFRFLRIFYFNCAAADSLTFFAFFTFALFAACTLLSLSVFIPSLSALLNKKRQSNTEPPVQQQQQEQQA